MIMEIAAAGAIAAGAVAVPSRGHSATAAYVYSVTQKGLSQLQNSFVFGLNSRVCDDLKQTYEECRSAGWDGHNAAPVPYESYEVALQFMKALPLGSPAPTVSAEPDGQITLEWYKTPRHVLSLSFAPDGTIHHAALLSDRKAFGSDLFYGEVPDTIMSLVKRISAA